MAVNHVLWLPARVLCQLGGSTSHRGQDTGTRLLRWLWTQLSGRVARVDVK